MSKIKMTDDTLKKATEKVFDEWIEQTEKCEKEFSPSESFEKEMNSFFKNRNKFSYKISHFKPRRSIVVIAAIFILMLSSLSVGAVRDEVKEIFKSTGIIQQEKTVKSKKSKKKKEKATNSSYYYQNTTSKPTTTKPQKTISVEYELDIDDLGYTRITENISPQKIFISYQTYDQSIKINFTQSVNEIEKPGDDGYYEVVGEQQYYIHRSPQDSRLRIYWQSGEYYFKVSGNISKETAFSYIALLKERVTQETTLPIEQEETTTSPFASTYGLDLSAFGYTESSYSVSEFKVSTVYSSSEGNNIYFYQENITSIDGRVDETVYVKSQEMVDGIEFTIYQLNESGTETIVFWQQDGYQFSIFADADKDQLIQYAKTRIIK